MSKTRYVTIRAAAEYIGLSYNFIYNDVRKNMLGKEFGIKVCPTGSDRVHYLLPLDLLKHYFDPCFKGLKAESFIE